MKKAIAISSLLLGVVFLSGCGQQPLSQTQSTTPSSVAQNPTTNQSPSTSADKKVATDSSCGSQVKDDSGITYGTVLAEDGKCWLDRNLGATEVATSPTDETSYGWYFQWGRGADGHQIPTSATTETSSSTDKPKNGKFVIFISDWRIPQNDKLWQGAGGINNPCPNGFRLPTSDEWAALVSVANIANSTTAFASSLKLPAAGFRDGLDGTMIFKAPEMSGAYWSSSIYGILAQDMVFGQTGAHPDGNTGRQMGLSVRCIKS